MHMPTRFIKRHAYQSQFSGCCGFSAFYTNASFLAFAGKGLKEINPDHHFGFLCAGTGSQLYLLGRSLSAYQLLHNIWCCALLIPCHLTVLQLNGERHMKPVLLRNIESTTTAEATLTW